MIGLQSIMACHLSFFQTVSALDINQSGHLFVGISGRGMYRSMDNGSRWMPINAGLRSTIITSLAISPIGYIFVGTIDGGVCDP